MDAVLTPGVLDETPSTAGRRIWLVPLALAMLGVVMFLFDISVASVFKHKDLPAAIDQPLREALEICESFGHGFGATLIMIAIAVLDPPKRRSLIWVFTGSLGAGFVANLFKLLVRRIRPRDFGMATGNVWNTFDKSFSGGSGMQSFPSAHTATAVGLALMLSAFYPRGRWYFLTMALLVGLQRIVSSSHFPSDVCAGAAVGWVVGTFCVSLISPSVGTGKP